MIIYGGRKRHLFISYIVMLFVLIVYISTFSFADPGRQKGLYIAKKVQLGVSLSKPSGEVCAQLPLLPHGSGFIVNTVTPDSSADKAGVKELDVIWKYNDQLLINKGQLAVLLSMKKPGESIVLYLFRAGESVELSVELKARPTHVSGSDTSHAEFPFPIAQSLSTKVVSYENRTASISGKEGSAILMYKDEQPWITVKSTTGEEVFSSEVALAADIARIPQPWRSRLPALKRSLRDSVTLGGSTRVRRVPTKSSKIRDLPDSSLVRKN